MPFMWSLRNPFYLSATRFTTQRQRRGGEEGGKKEKKKKNLQVQAWRGEDEYHRRILSTKALRGATRVLYLLTAKTQEQERGMWTSGCVRQEIHFVLTVAQMCIQRQIQSLMGWGNVCYLCNYELNRVWSWSSESWTWISIFSPHRAQCTPPNTS